MPSWWVADRAESNLAHVLQRLTNGKRAAGVQLLAQGPPFKALHHEVGTPIRRLARVAYRDDVGVRERCEGPGLDAQAVHQLGLLRKRLVQELDDDS